MTQTAPETLGDAIALVRAFREMTQEELADAAQIGQATISQIEGGSRQPSMETLRAIAELGVTPSIPLMITEPRKPAPKELRGLVEDVRAELLEILLAQGKVTLRVTLSQTAKASRPKKKP